MKQFLETIGSVLYDADINDHETLTNLNIIKDSYIPIGWPEIQDFMEEEWFNNEAILDVENKLGDSTYFIPLKRIIN